MDPKKPEIIHRKQLFGGRESAEEVHRKIAWQGKRCQACGGPPALCIRAFAPVDWFLERFPQMAMKLAFANEGRIPLAQFTMGKYVRFAEVHACDRCKLTAEREAAKYPSFIVVQIDRGPGPDRIISQVG